ncbi:MAG TPA: hypothetical protein P5514_16035 [Bacteroidales bacterium]|nr:hypothetical protein [Bacteroidales bacterium]HRX98455.1 hypothetical protein [Bacteroidales bacterium]
MKKITDKDYTLPVIKALQGIKLFESGTTQPMLIRGINTVTYEKSDFIVKYIGSPRMSPESSCRELTAAFLAMELGLNVAEPAVIEVSQEFTDAIRGKQGYPFAINSIGLNFGSKFLGYGFIELLRNQELNDDQYKQAVQIFAFDLLISNADRNNRKQNLLTDGKEIAIFDHEMAFGFVMDIIKNPTPWIFSTIEKTWIKEHFFYPLLKQNEHNFDNFVQSFAVINEVFWDKATALIPNEWITDQFDEIKQTLTKIIEHKATFLDELKKVLS